MTVAIIIDYVSIIYAIVLPWFGTTNDNIGREL